MTTGVSAAPIDNVNNAPEKTIGKEIVGEEMEGVRKRKQRKTIRSEI